MRENLEAFGAFPQNSRYVFDESDCKRCYETGGEKMMDLIMIGILLGSFGLIKLFADFCESQIEPKKNETNRER